MTARFLPWWRLRSVREQRLLLAMAALLIVTLAWLAVIRPFGDLLADARAQAARAAIATGEARAQADAIRAIERATPATLRAPVARTVAEAAAEAGLPADRITTAADGTVTIAIDSARGPALFGWIEGLETRRGLVVERMSAQPGGDRTVSAQVTFRERGR